MQGLPWVLAAQHGARCRREHAHRVSDWGRKTSAGQTELLGETEDLSQDTSRNRSISEVTERLPQRRRPAFNTESKSRPSKPGPPEDFHPAVWRREPAPASAKTSTPPTATATSAGSRQVGASMPPMNASDRTAPARPCSPHATRFRCARSEPIRA